VVDISNEIKGSLSSKNQPEIQEESNVEVEEEEDLIWSPPLSNQQINQISFKEESKNKMREFYMRDDLETKFIIYHLFNKK